MKLSINNVLPLILQVSPGFGGTGVFSLGSRFRYSGHTEKQVMQEVQNVRRQPPQVCVLSLLYLVVVGNICSF